MKVINSLDNNLIKKFRSLSVKKYREQFALCVLEGEKMVVEALNHENLVEYLIVEESNKSQFESLINKFDNKVLLVSHEVYKSLAYALSPQKIMAIINIKKEAPIDFSKNLIVLDHIQDPGNLGTIIRSSVASGHSEIVLIDSVDPYNDKVMRSATGTLFKANFHTIKRDEFIKMAKTQNLNLVVADMDGENLFSDDLSITSPYALVIGSEGQGVSSEILNITHKTIAIPMENGVESLNAGTSASIVMFNLRAKN